MAIDIEKLNIVIEGEATKASKAIDNLIEKLGSIQGVFSKLNETANGFTSAFRNASNSATAATKGFENVNETLNGTAKVNEKVANAAQRVEKELSKTKQAVSSVGKVADSQKSKLGKFLETFGRVAKMRLMRWTLRQIVNTLKEGLEMLVEWDRTFGNNTSYAAKTVDELSAKWGEVKKAIGAAVMPLIQMLQPAITWILNAVISIFNALNQILRSAQGFSTYMKATAVNTQSAVSAAKELRRVLFGFDELNVLNGNGGTGAAGFSASEPFVETSIDQESVWKRIGDAIANAYGKLKTYWDKIKPVVEDVWNDWQERSKGISDWIKEQYDYIKDHWDEIEDGVKKVKIWLIEHIELPLKQAFANFSEWMLTNHPKLAKFLGLSNEKLEALKLEIQALTSLDNNTEELIATPMIREGRQLTKYKVNFETDTFLSADTKKLYEIMNGALKGVSVYLGDSSMKMAVSGIVGGAYASGGDPDMGTLFWAGEQGAEVVASSSSGTGVMNMKQMQDAVSNGNAQVVNAIGAMTNIVVNAINNIDPNTYLDGQKITDNVVRRVNNMSRATGQPVLAR